MLPKVRIHFPPFHPGQQEVYDAFRKFRFIVLACGRRWGKTTFAVVVAIMMMVRDGANVMWVAPTHRQSQIGWRLAKRIALQINKAFLKAGQKPLIRILEQEKIMVSASGGVIQFRSGEKPHNLRGEGLDVVILDEAAHMKEEVWEESVQPALMDHKGKAIFISTPKGRHNWFYDVFRMAEEYPDEWKAFRRPSWENPRLDPAEIEKMRKRMPLLVFRQEILAEFVEEGALFENVIELATVHPQEAPEPGHRYSMGIDWASPQGQDYTVAMLVDVCCMKQVYYWRSSGLPLYDQRQAIKELYQLWKPYVVFSETNSMGLGQSEGLAMDGVPVFGVYVEGRRKTEMIVNLAMLLSEKKFRLLADPVIIDEFLSFQAKITPTGTIRYYASRKKHDDTVMATALALHAVSQGQVGFGIIEVPGA